MGDRRGGAGVPRRLRPRLRRRRLRAGGCDAAQRQPRAVFAAGDCASIDGKPRPKAGVWAVRAGPPLAANLRRAARGRPLRRWRPHRDALVILGLGDGRAVAWRNGVAVAGRAMWRWKDWIDRRWMRMYHRDADGGRCRGAIRCAAAAAAPRSAPRCWPAALAGSAATPGADMLIGLDAPDDAAVMLPPPGMALVQSVDHFRAFIDDPFVFGADRRRARAVRPARDGRAALDGAGGRRGALCRPGDKMRAELADMLQGATRVLAADGCALVGGHSAEAAEPALGFAVTGLADPAKLLRKSGLRPAMRWC